MRTTVSIEDSLFEKAKRASLERSCTLGEVIEDALRSALAAKPKSGRNRSIRPLKTFRGTGLRAGADLDESAALLDLMEGG